MKTVAHIKRKIIVSSVLLVVATAGRSSYAGGDCGQVFGGSKVTHHSSQYAHAFVEFQNELLGLVLKSSYSKVVSQLKEKGADLSKNKLWRIVNSDKYLTVEPELIRAVELVIERPVELSGNRISKESLTDLRERLDVSYDHLVELLKAKKNIETSKNKLWRVLKSATTKDDPALLTAIYEILMEVSALIEAQQ